MSARNYFDLIVVGCGAAGLSAAVSFAETMRDAGRFGRVAILERASRENRGGGTQWTGAFLRIKENRTFDSAWPERMARVSGGLADDAYCKKLVSETPTTLKFLEERGVEILFPKFPFAHTFGDEPEPGIVPPGMPNGGGAAIVSAFCGLLEQMPNVEFMYETEALRLITDDEGVVAGLKIRSQNGRTSTLDAGAVVLACGGFQGNAEMLTRYLGSRACDLPVIAPGSAYNRGDGIRMAMELGADLAGQFDMIHAEPVDRRTKKADSVIYTYTGGIFVNGSAERFYDEGCATWDNTFELIGYEIWKNQNQEAYWIADRNTTDVEGWEMGYLSDVPPETADTIKELAVKLGLDPDALEKAVETFNAAACDGPFNPARVDGKSTTGLHPPKSNWAVKLNKGPYIGMPLTAAICFTYGGVKTDLDGRVVAPGGVPIPNLYAAGEMTGLFYHEYPPATSVLRSLTFGRIAGAHAAAAIGRNSKAA